MKITAAILLAVTALSCPARADTYACDDKRFTVLTNDPALARTTCIAAVRSVNTLAECSIPFSSPAEIKMTEDLGKGCMGLFHCGQSRIELLTPDSMQARRNPESSLAHVQTPDFFVSVLAHELAHAVYDGLPCPVENCVNSSEYLAHAIQVMSLPPDDIVTLENQFDMATEISRDEISAMILYMAPDVYLRTVWAHLNQRPDACTYLRAIMSGTVLLDRARP